MEFINHIISAYFQAYGTYLHDPLMWFFLIVNSPICYYVGEKLRRPPFQSMMIGAAFAFLWACPLFVYHFMQVW